MGYKRIKDWPEEERPRERLLKHGAAGMSEAQLLAIILRTGGQGKSAMDMAIELIDKMGGIGNMEQDSARQRPPR
ncbi:MAG: hypothetical protein M0Z60_14900 [Nitrospiraceae bacterium]|nr:hypothetical protein [Nitrospiraceae bacterium]